MSGKILKEKLMHGETVYGTLIQHAVNPGVADFIPPDTLDFVIFTAEHNALDLADFLPLSYALKAKGIACLVRTHSRDESDVAKVCDTFDGVVVPYVEDFEHCKRLAAAAIYRPLKGEVLERVITKGEWPSEESREYVLKRNEETVFIPMIESVPAVEHLDEICSIPGVHAAFIGPGDLTCNMGIPGQYDHPDLIKMIKRIIDTADRHHVAAGSWFGTREQTLRTIKQGARLVVHSNDSSMMGAEIQSAFTQFRKG